MWYKSSAPNFGIERNRPRLASGLPGFDCNDVLFMRVTKHHLDTPNEGPGQPAPREGSRYPDSQPVSMFRLSAITPGEAHPAAPFCRPQALERAEEVTAAKRFAQGLPHSAKTTVPLIFVKNIFHRSKSCRAFALVHLQTAIVALLWRNCCTDAFHRPHPHFFHWFVPKLLLEWYAGESSFSNLLVAETSHNFGPRFGCLNAPCRRAGG